MGTRHVQLHVDAMRWSDEALAGILESDGRPLTGPEVREHLRELKASGLEVVPCPRCICDPEGHCTGRPLVLREDAP